MAPCTYYALIIAGCQGKRGVEFREWGVEIVVRKIILFYHA
jgi:hypothetical protein